MKRIYKYNFEITDRQVIRRLLGRVLSVGLDPNGVPAMWVEVDPDDDDVDSLLHVVGTGHQIPEASHRGTFLMPPFVWHLYENIPAFTVLD